MSFACNDILISEIPYASIVKHLLIKSVCSNCFKENAKLLTCQQCKNNSYCNKDCQKKDWKLHKLECKSFSTSSILPGDISLLVLRIMQRNKENMNNKSIGVLSNKYGFKPRCFDDLVSNLEVENSTILKDFDNMMNEIEKFLEPIGIKFSDFISNNDAKIIFAKSLTNNFEIQNENNVTVGYGCYLNGSGFNHSCWPNAVYNFNGNRLVLRALKAIESTSPVFINYTDPLQLRAERQSQLRQQYLFECQCEACCDDELEREMSQLFCSQQNCTGSVRLMYDSHDYQCNKCAQIEQKQQMEMRQSMNKAKIFLINNLMIKNEYRKALELSMLALKDFNLESQPENDGGLYQLLLGEKAFETAIFLQEYFIAIEVCLLKSRTSSWIHERLVRFLGSENHPIANCHLDKFQKLLDYHN